MNRIVVIGASGKLGRAIVAEAVRRGLAVTAMVRDRNKFRFAEGIEIVEGDGRDETALSKAIAGADAVVISAGGARSPVTSQIAAAVIPLMKREGIRRLVALSADGAVNPRGLYPWLLRLIIPKEVKDDIATEAALQASGLDWTAIRPGILTNGAATNEVKTSEGEHLRGFPRISRADVAVFIVEELLDPRFIGKTPTVFV